MDPMTLKLLASKTGGEGEVGPQVGPKAAKPHMKEVVNRSKKAMGTLLSAGLSTAVSGISTHINQRIAQDHEEYNMRMADINSSIVNPDMGGYFKYGGQLKKYPMGGEVAYSEPTPVQTEKGEMISFEGNVISPVKAKKKHKNMGSTEVTDVLPPEATIYSDRVMITKEQADEFPVSVTPFMYSDTELHEVKMTTLGDLFGNKKKMSAAELVKRIKKRMPTVEDDGDILAKSTNEQNLIARGPYLEAVKVLNLLNMPSAIIDDALNEGIEPEDIPEIEAPMDMFPYGRIGGGGGEEGLDDIMPYDTSYINQYAEAFYKGGAKPKPNEPGPRKSADCSGFVCDVAPRIGIDIGENPLKFDAEKYGGLEAVTEKYGVYPDIKQPDGSWIKGEEKVLGGAARMALRSNAVAEENTYKSHKDFMADIDNIPDRSIIFQKRADEGIYHVGLFRNIDGEPQWQEMTIDRHGATDRSGVLNLKGKEEIGKRFAEYDGGKATIHIGRYDNTKEYEAEREKRIRDVKTFSDLSGRAPEVSRESTSVHTMRSLDKPTENLNPKLKSLLRDKIIHKKYGGKVKKYPYGNTNEEDRPKQKHFSPVGVITNLAEEGMLPMTSLPLPKDEEGFQLKSQNTPPPLTLTLSDEGKKDPYLEHLNEQDQYLDESLDTAYRDADSAYLNQGVLMGAGTLAHTLGTMAQDPTVVAPELDFSHLRSMPRRVPRSVHDRQANTLNRQQRTTADTLTRNTSRLNRIAAVLTNAGATSAEATSDLAFQEAQANVGLETNRAGALTEMSTQQRMIAADATNRTRANANTQTALVTRGVVNATNQLAGLDAARTTYRNQARATHNTAKQQLLSNRLLYSKYLKM